MAHLTNGSVSYERRVKTGDFEHKHAAVTINYSLDEGDDADELLARARTLVVQHVHYAVGIKAVPVPVAGNSALPGSGGSSDPGHAPPGVDHEVHPVVAGNDATDNHTASDPVEDLGVVVPDELNRGFIVPESFTKPDEELLPRTTLKEALAEIIPPVTNLKAAKRAAKKRGPVITNVVEKPYLPETASAWLGAVVDEVIEDPTPVATVSSAPSSAPVVETSLASSEIVVDDFTAVAPAATDVDLSQALSRVNAKLKDRPRIQALIGEFVQSGQSYVMIPAVRRAEFVTRLEALV